MSGTIANAAVWSEADVFIGSLTATVPTTNAAYTLNETSGGTTGVVAQWDFVGLLDGSAGFGEQESETVTDFSAWGYGIIQSAHKDYKLTRTFTALEDNAAVLGLLYDATGLTWTGANFAGDLAVRDTAREFLIGFDVRANGTLKRYISAGFAKVDSIGAVTESEDAIQSRPITVTIYPDNNKNLWKTYKGADS